MHDKKGDRVAKSISRFPPRHSSSLRFFPSWNPSKSQTLCSCIPKTPGDNEGKGIPRRLVPFPSSKYFEARSQPAPDERRGTRKRYSRISAYGRIQHFQLELASYPLETHFELPARLILPLVPSPNSSTLQAPLIVRVDSPTNSGFLGQR